MRYVACSMRNLLALGACLPILSASACGAPPAPTTPAPMPAADAGAAPTHGHVHDDHTGHNAHAHGPLVHRFERAEQWAADFDDPARDAWQHPKDIIDAMALRPGMKVADIGAGTGYFEPWLSRAVGDAGAVLALDIEPDMVRYLTERAAREHLANVRPALSAMDDPKLPSESVDRIVIVDTWHHVPEREAYAARLREALVPGGQVVVVDFKLDAKHGPPPQHRLTAEQVVRELTAGGLAAQVSPTTLPEQYIVIGTRR
jgi:SAM-dependent methyltransferase